MKLIPVYLPAICSQSHCQVQYTEEKGSVLIAWVSCYSSKKILYYYYYYYYYYYCCCCCYPN